MGTRPVVRRGEGRPNPGANIEEITEAFGILPHSARAMISVTAKRLGVKIDLDKENKAYLLHPT